MHVLIDGTTLGGQRTGIGWYTHRLLLAMQAHGGVADVGIVVNGRIRPLQTQFASATEEHKPSLVGRVAAGARAAVRDFVPFARQAVTAIRTRRLRKACDGWTIFHQPNYASAPIPLPLVTTVCDMSYASCPQWMPRERRNWLRRSLGASLERSRAIITISDFTRGELLAHFPKLDADRVFVTPLGVDHARFHCETGQANASLRERLSLPRQFVLFLGTLEPRKNLHGLLDAYAQLPSDLQREYPLVLAGVSGWRQGYFRSKLATLARAGVVQTLGYVAQDDVPALLRAATMLAFPSLYEGFGLPVLEAAACGTPVLCSRAASLPEVLGDAACYVDPHDVDDIASGLVRMLTDDALRRRYSALGRERSLLFSWERCAAETMRAYRAAA